MSSLSVGRIARRGDSGYAPACANEWQRGICEKPKVKCSACPNQAFQAVDEVSIERHLRGTDTNGAPFVMGVYPMLADNTCSFLAADFDEGEWRRDVFAFRETCQRHEIPVAIERSRSGNGAHAWIFFEEPIPARRRAVSGLSLSPTRWNVSPISDSDPDDRFFPSQDTMPAGGFGNLIALPLQGLAEALATACSSTSFVRHIRINGPSCQRLNLSRDRGWIIWSRKRVHLEKFSAYVFLLSTKTKNRGLPRHRADSHRQQ